MYWVMNHSRGKLGLHGCSEDFGAQEEELRLVAELRLRSGLFIFYTALL